tara:strand:+ start:222 stop:695 length:474 start_codon:yes stop_codon:yes gene_type:complete
LVKSSNPQKWLSLKRTVRFGETDGAGVIHFYQVLKWSHEAWEESLELYGLSAKEIFPNNLAKEKNKIIALPIVNCDAIYLHPIYVGDYLEIKLLPKKVDSSSFYLEVNFIRDDKLVALGRLKHIAINSETRERIVLPEGIELWLEYSLIGLGVHSST